MIDEKAMTVKAQRCIRTLRLKVKAEAYPWLNAAAGSRRMQSETGGCVFPSRG
jgi:hypothetical protein